MTSSMSSAYERVTKLTSVQLIMNIRVKSNPLLPHSTQSESPERSLANVADGVKRKQAATMKISNSCLVFLLEKKKKVKQQRHARPPRIIEFKLPHRLLKMWKNVENRGRVCDSFSIASVSTLSYLSRSQNAEVVSGGEGFALPRGEERTMIKDDVGTGGGVGMMAYGLFWYGNWINGLVWCLR